MGTTQEHPDLVDLDALRTGDGSTADAAHVTSCSICQELLAGLGGLSTMLRENYGSPVAVPDAIEQRILWQARKQARLARRGAALRTQGARWAFAASVLLAVGALTFWRTAQRQGTVPVRIASAPSVARDIDGDGKVDILDAFALARTMRSGASIPAEWDLDGNGRVDEADVDAIARAAVSLKGA